MNFFNSLSIRITLALIGGILYGLLTYALVLTLDLPPQAAMGAAFFISLFYIGSRFLILFSGINTPYYFKGHKDSPYESTPFYQTAQWVGRFYHYHDIVLFAFLALIAIIFLISLIMDWAQSNPPGNTIYNLLQFLLPMPQ